MVNMIENYIKNINESDVLNFANKENINLNKKELKFVYSFIKNNYREVIKEGKNFNLKKYKNEFTEENYNKLEKLMFKYSQLL